MIGYLFGTLGMYKSSLEYFKKSLIIMENIFEKDHPEVF